ncbi:MAG: DUF433 domain-containing protein [Propionibacteriaceae bacterium]|nr:DUF433 domain-containing protein [Propionibacteriaceae bacterium]
MAAFLSGATEAQLRYWRRAREGEPPLLKPGVASQPRALYSYRDLIVLRTFAHLREQVSLQTIRRMVTWLEENVTDGKDLSERTLRPIPEKRSIAYFDDDGQIVDVGREPGQYSHRLVMEDIFRPFVNLHGDEVPDFTHPADGLLVDPEICGGIPVVDGTRIPFNLIAGLARDGLSLEAIQLFYPGVPAEAVKGAAELADRIDYARAA